MVLPQIPHAILGRRWLPTTRTLLACAVLASLGFMIICGTLLLEARRDAARQAEATASRLAAAVAQDVARIIEFYDVALQAMIVGLRTPNVRDLDPQLRNLILFDRLAGTRHLGFIEALDDKGDVIASWPPAQHVNNWANRDYFVVPRRDPSNRLHISHPFAIGQDEFASVAISRRMSNANGDFAGVVVASLRLGYFRDLFSKLELGPYGSVALLRDDGVILARQPFDRNDTGRTVAFASPLGSFMRTGTTPIAARDTVDGVTRQFTFRRIGDLPLILAVGLASNDIYAGWWVKVMYVLAAGVLLSSANALLVRKLWLELQLREAVERESQGKSRLLATMNHELRTPLHGILGYAERLSVEGNLNPAQSRHIAAIVSAGRHMRDVVNRALDYAWIEARGPEPHMQRIDLPELLDQCRAVVEPSATARGIGLHFAVLSGAPRFFATDPALLRQVLTNLLDNAVKYTRHGQVELRLGGFDDRISIEVADTGSGVPTEQRCKLFKEYERLGAEQTATEGAGLGLAIAARLVRSMGGNIGYRDNPGGGSIFWFDLPGRMADQPYKPADEQEEASCSRGLHILVADDSLMNRDVAAHFLRAAGHSVVEVQNGDDAVRLAATGDFDVVLMDMRMPGTDGLSATRQIRSLPGSRGCVPIVAVTANARDEHAERCRQLGMSAHLSKPFTQAELLAVVAHAAARRPTTLSGEPPAFDPAVLVDLTACMGAEAIDEHLRTLSLRVEALLHKLDEPDAFMVPQELAVIAHELAGSAGTFGFIALSVAARHFETALRAEPSQAASTADRLAAVARVTLAEVRQCGLGESIALV